MDNNIIKEYTIQRNGINIKVRSNTPSEKALNEFANELVSLYNKNQVREDIV